MKAILVIDMPTNCAKCKLAHLQGIGESICNAVDWDRRPEWCPLKPMPKRKDILDSRMKTAIGWNECIEEIEK